MNKGFENANANTATKEIGIRFYIGNGKYVKHPSEIPNTKEYDWVREQYVDEEGHWI